MESDAGRVAEYSTANLEIFLCCSFSLSWGRRFLARAAVPFFDGYLSAGWGLQLFPRLRLPLAGESLGFGELVGRH